VAPAQEISGGRGAVDRGQSAGAGPGRRLARVGALGGGGRAAEGTTRGASYRAAAGADVPGATWPIRRAHCPSPASGPESQRVRTVVLGGGATHGHLGLEGSGAAAPGAAVRHGRDVRADRRVGGRNRPPRPANGGRGPVSLSQVSPSKHNPITCFSPVSLRSSSAHPNRFAAARADARWMAAFSDAVDPPVRLRRAIGGP